MSEEKEVEQQIKYLNRETGLEISGSENIHYYMCSQNDEIIDNLLMGKYRNDGSYYVEKDYLIELIKINKYVAQSEENKYILIGPVKSHEFKFTMIIETVGNGKKCASLRLIEQVNKENGKTELLKTMVARYTDDADQYFMTKVNKVFSIKEKNEVDGDVIDEEVLSNILRRMKEMNVMKKERADSLDYISNTYIDNILKTLKNNPGKFSELVLRKYQVLMGEMESKIGQPNYYILLRKGLDKILTETSEYLKDKKLLESLAKTKEDYVTNYKQVHKEILESMDRKPAPAPKKEEKTKSKSAESGGGSKPKKSASKKKGAPKKSASKKEEKSEPKKWIDIANLPSYNLPSNSSAQKNKNNDKDQSTTVMLPTTMAHIINQIETTETVNAKLLNSQKKLPTVGLSNSLQERDMGF